MHTSPHVTPGRRSIQLHGSRNLSLWHNTEASQAMSQSSGAVKGYSLVCEAASRASSCTT